MAIIDEKIKDIFSNDPLNLLSLEPSENKEGGDNAANERIISRFEEINTFFENNNRIPQFNGDVEEFSLASRLESIKANPDYVKILKKYDFYNILNSDEARTLTVDDILNDDPLNLLRTDNIDDSVFKLTHVKKSNRIRPDYVSRRNVCKNFNEYEKAFTLLHNDLKTGKRRLVQYSEDQLRVGRYYVLRGVILYLEKADADIEKYEYESGSRTREDGRTRCIFDNGTESDMLLRSLGKALLKDGFCISEPIEESSTTEIRPDDRQNGYIYVLRSLSSDPQIRSFDNLYKIGYCSGDITDRIKNSKNEPTYLMSDVRVDLAVRCFNMDVRAFEDAIHRFFSEVNVRFEIKDENGEIHYPREWFVVPLNIIKDAIQLIAEGKADTCSYNPTLQLLVQNNKDGED